MNNMNVSHAVGVSSWRKENYFLYLQKDFKQINVRISNKEITTIKNSILVYDKNAQIYLFGSRTDDSAKGGDIDVLIISDKLDFEKKVAIKSLIFQEMEEQKIDLVLAKSSDASPFIKMIFKTAEQL